MSEDAENVDIFFEAFAVVRGRHAGDARDVRVSFRVQVGVCGSRGEVGFTCHVTDFRVW